MQAQIENLAQSTIERFSDIPPTERLLVSICGIPGSGKTSLAIRVVGTLNEYYGADIATVIPMDGYHLTRAQLSALPNAQEAHYFRGAHWTFDPVSLAQLLKACKSPPPLNPNTTTTPSQVNPLPLETANPLPIPQASAHPPGTLYAASFDHAVKDPVENDIPILPSHRILIFEGNYLSLSAPPEWLEVSNKFDLRWYVKVDEERARERLAQRHLKAGIVGTIEEGYERAEKNDLPNGRFLIANMVPVDFVVESIEDPGLKM